MDRNELFTNLKVVNEEATKVANQLKESNNPELLIPYLTDLANRIYMMGVKDGESQKQ